MFITDVFLFMVVGCYCLVIGVRGSKPKVSTLSAIGIGPRKVSVLRNVKIKGFFLLSDRDQAEEGDCP